MAALGVYVHWPYCARICPYCDFNVYKNRPLDAGDWRDALLHDLRRWRARTPATPLASLYFGGGTPSLAPLSVIEAVIDACERLWGFAPGAEITLEANPTDAEQARFRAFAGAGINRLSLGVQSLRDEALTFLGREHDAAAARSAIEAAMAAFDAVTFDLIYARPGQDVRAWGEELAEALAFGTAHLSLYQLTIEPGTAFDRAVARGRWSPPEDDACADMFDLAQEMTAAAGLPAYEISNHARPGAQSRHNLLYWTYADYVGIGPGAHGRLTADGVKIAAEAPARPADYLAGQAAREQALTLEETLIERFSMGLRLMAGVALAPDDALFSLPDMNERIARLAADGLLVHAGGRLAATPEGRRILNRVLYELFG